MKITAKRRDPASGGKPNHKPIKSSYGEYTEDDYILLDVKSIHDADGWLTDYALYKTPDDAWFFCMFGDTDVYPPDLDYADAEFDNYAEAREWFDNYSDLDEDEY